MDRVFATANFHLPPARIALLRFLVEGYDGLLFLRTVDAKSGLVELSWPPSQARDAVTVLAALARDCAMQRV